MKRYFKGSKGHANSCSTFWEFKKAIWTTSQRWCLSRREIMRTHNLPTGNFKKRLCWSRWSDVSRYRKSLRTHFLPPGHRKKRLGRSHLSDVLIGQRSWKLLICLLNISKNEFFENDEACFKVSKGHAKSLSESCASKKRLGRSRLSHDLSKRMGLRTHNMHNGSLKKRLW
jgi:hypothetical protein